MPCKVVAGGRICMRLTHTCPPGRPAPIRRGASAADVRKAYKRLALLYHPDKHKGEGEEQQAAIADKFKQARRGGRGRMVGGGSCRVRCHTSSPAEGAPAA